MERHLVGAVVQYVAYLHADLCGRIHVDAVHADAVAHQRLHTTHLGQDRAREAWRRPGKDGGSATATVDKRRPFVALGPHDLDAKRGQHGLLDIERIEARATHDDAPRARGGPVIARSRSSTPRDAANGDGAA